MTRHALSRKPPNPGDNTERGSSQHAPTTENQPQDLTLAKRIRTNQETETQNQPRRDLAEGRRKMKDRRDWSLIRTPHVINLLVRTLGPGKSWWNTDDLNRRERGSTLVRELSSPPPWYLQIRRKDLQRRHEGTDHPWTRLHRLALARKRRRHTRSGTTHAKLLRSTANRTEAWGGEANKSFDKDRKEEEKADGAKRKRKQGAPDDGLRNHRRRSRNDEMR